MAINVEKLKQLQSKKGSNAIRGKFWLVGNPNTAEEITLGYTQEGTFSIDRSYRDADQNQTVSKVKGLKFLDEASVMFETQSLQLDENVMTKFKGLVSETYTDESDGKGYVKLTEQAFVDYVRYINTLAIIAETTDGRNVVIEMYNVLETSSESIEFNRTDDTTIALTFEAHITDADNDEVLPYAIFIEQESTEEILRRASGLISKTQFESIVGSVEFTFDLETAISSKLKSEGEDFKDITVEIFNFDGSDLVGKVAGDLIKDIDVRYTLETKVEEGKVASVLIGGTPTRKVKKEKES